MAWVRIPPLPNISFGEEKPELRQVVEVAVAMEHKNDVSIVIASQLMYVGMHGLHGSYKCYTLLLYGSGFVSVSAST